MLRDPSFRTVPAFVAMSVGTNSIFFWMIWKEDVTPKSWQASDVRGCRNGHREEKSGLIILPGYARVPDLYRLTGSRFSIFQVPKQGKEPEPEIQLSVSA